MTISEQDRHELYIRLADVLGTGPAATLMSHLPPVGWADVATKHDLVLVRSEVGALGRELRLEMASLGSDLRGEMARVYGEMGMLRGDLATEMGRLRADLLGEITKQGRAFVMALVTALAAQTGLVFALVQARVL